MNKGTRLRTIAFILACINQAIMTIGDVDFGEPTVNLIYKIITILFTIVSGAFALYFNNDFTEEACLGTAITRQLKAEKQEDYIGDYFYTENIAEVGDNDESDNL